MRVYHFVNQEFGLDDLKRRRLKIATIEDLNDPFEMLGFSNRDPKFRKAWSLIRTLLHSRFGLVCFSNSYRNPVQWSHYADGHRGLCLGFDVPKRLLTEVKYSPDGLMPDYELFAKSSAHASQELVRILATKFIHWQYEGEQRYFIPLSMVSPIRGFYFEPFSHLMRLREVIVGHRSAITRSEIKAIPVIKEGGIDIFKARLAFQSFEVVRQKNDRLW
jgi:hypothetical protein